MGEIILEVKDLKKYYGRKGSETKALDGINLKVTDGEFIGIMDGSSSGKITLLNCIATTIHPSEENIILRDENIESFKGNKLSYLFQNFNLLENLTARENILLQMAIHNKIDKNSNNKIEELA